MAVWVAGGAIALLGAGIFAELAARRPADGGLYAYLRDAFHPALAFIFGWTLLLVSQSGGMAAAAVTFANYFATLDDVARFYCGSRRRCNRGIHRDQRAGRSHRNDDAKRVHGGQDSRDRGIRSDRSFRLTRGAAAPMPVHAPAAGALAVIGLAMVPVLFAYSGWQTSSFMTAELHQPQKTLPRGLIAGVVLVVALYLAVNATCLHVLGIDGLAATNTPASQVAGIAFGPIGLTIMAAVIALSTLGFLSNQILTSPRVYFQMAADGTFFKQLAWVNPRTHAPVSRLCCKG